MKYSWCDPKQIKHTYFWGKLHIYPVLSACKWMYAQTGTATANPSYRYFNRTYRDD